MSNINTKQWKDHEKILLSAYQNLITFGKLFLQDFQKSVNPQFHYEIGEELISESTKPCAIIVARGHGKTTLIKTKIIRDFCFAKKAHEWGFAPAQRNLFYGWVSLNQKKSKNNVYYVKLNLEYNELIKFYFGRDGSSLRGEPWNQEDITTIYGDRLVSSSNLTSMRGDTLATLHAGNLRYSCVFIDDVESEDNTRTENAREKIVDTIMNGIYPAIEKNEPGCRLFLVETPVHWDSFAQRIMDKWAEVQAQGQEAIDKYSWKVVVYGVEQPTMPGGVLWESFFPREKLLEMKNMYNDSPRGVEGYYQEYELQVQSSETSLWNRKHIKFWKGTYRFDPSYGGSIIYHEGQIKPVNVFIGCDPATDIQTKTSDFSVTMAIAVDADHNVYVLDYVRRRSMPTIGIRNANGDLVDRPGVVDIIIDYYFRYHFDLAVIEDVTVTRSVFQAIDSERHRRNLWRMPVRGEPPGGMKKRDRIYSELAARFSSGKIHLLENHYELINEIIKFGEKMPHDDTIEALYYGCLKAYPPGRKIVDDVPTSIYEVKEPKSWITA
jgi:hypothetical protein